MAKHSFVRGDTPSPEERPSCRIDETMVIEPSSDDYNESFRQVAPSSASLPATAVIPSFASFAPTPSVAAGTPVVAQPHGPAVMAAPFSAPQNATSYTTAWPSTQSVAPPRNLVTPFNAMQSDMIIYLALRRASKAAIAYAIRRECVNLSELHISAENWEGSAEEMIKAELRGHIKAPGADYVEDASAIVARIQGCVETYGWHNSIIVRAADYMAVIETATTRAEIVEDIEKRAKVRAARKKKAAKAAIKAIGSLVGDQVMARQQMFEAGLARADLGANLDSEDAMELNLFFLQYTSMIVDMNLADW